MQRLLAIAAVTALGVACGDAKNDRRTPERLPAERPSVAADAGAVPAAVGPGPASAGPRVLFVGTSLTAGLGLDPDSAYPALVERRARAAGRPIVVTNAGVSGETSAGALRRIDWLVKEPVDVVVIETGANDGLRGVDPDSTAANLRAIIARVKAAQPRAAIALVQMEAPPNLGVSYTGRFRAMYPTVARETGATLLPFLLDGVAGVASLNQADGIHPNEEGARRVASTVWGALEPLVGAPAR
ncbi:MAG: arylesterase [Gemmatimonadaceae bacterium]|jgi:acyl-CoA thioesterase-1|nr:arylesterase [Gemmatimonadaceae bacterium]